MTPPPLPKIRTYVYKDIRPVAALTKTFVILYAIVAIALLAGLAMQWELFHRDGFTAEEAQANDNFMALVNYFRVGTYVLTGVSVMVWTYRAHTNARAQSAVGLTTEPGVACVSYFIPFANFWVPFQCMKELWRHTFAQSETKGADTSALLGGWWTAWLLSLFLGVYADKFIKIKDLPSGIYATEVWIMQTSCSVTAALLLGRIISRISADQANRRMLATLPRADGAIS